MGLKENEDRPSVVRAHGSGTWLTIAALWLSLAVVAPEPAAAQGAPEFTKDFYNASKCIKTDEVNNNGLRVITAQNLCNANVAALVCFRIVQATNAFSSVGWYCDYSNLYGPGTSRTIARSGFYHPKRKIAACAIGNTRCDQVLRTTDVRVRENRRDPEGVAVAIRDQVGN